MPPPTKQQRDRDERERAAATRFGRAVPLHRRRGRRFVDARERERVEDVARVGHARWIARLRGTGVTTSFGCARPCTSRPRLDRRGARSAAAAADGGGSEAAGDRRDGVLRLRRRRPSANGSTVGAFIGYLRAAGATGGRRRVRRRHRRRHCIALGGRFVVVVGRWRDSGRRSGEVRATSAATARAPAFVCIGLKTRERSIHVFVCSSLTAELDGALEDFLGAVGVAAAQQAPRRARGKRARPAARFSRRRRERSAPRRACSCACTCARPRPAPARSTRTSPARSRPLAGRGSSERPRAPRRAGWWSRRLATSSSVLRARRLGRASEGRLPTIAGSNRDREPFTAWCMRASYEG